MVRVIAHKKIKCLQIRTLIVYSRKIVIKIYHGIIDNMFPKTYFYLSRMYSAML